MRAPRIALLLPFAFFGCVSSPPPNPVKEVGPDTYSIRYSSNAHGSKMEPEDRVLFLAADTTLSHGRRYFAIIGIGDEASAGTSTDTTPDKRAPSLALQNVYGIYGVGGTVPQQPVTDAQLAVVKKGITIKCFDHQPADLIASDATAVERDIKKKYSLP